LTFGFAAGDSTLTETGPFSVNIGAALVGLNGIVVNSAGLHVTLTSTAGNNFNIRRTHPRHGRLILTAR
jgi:hypothetical protein